MIKTLLLSTLYVILIFFIHDNAIAEWGTDANGWKAGVATVIITPEEPMWMAGYASRNQPSQGTLHDLYAKALALEDARGNRVVLVTTDLLGFPFKMSHQIRNRIAAEYGLEKSQIVLSSSHTHSGPVLMDALFDIYPLDDSHIEIIRNYSKNLEEKIVALAGEAIRSMTPARLYSENGVVRFQVNRRNNNEATLHSQTELRGPNDHTAPVIRVLDESDRLLAIVFGYACHPTVLDTYQFSGDYAGFAQIELENLYPGTVAMFFQGAGADQNPLPRRTVPLARQYGRKLAAAVDRVLNEEMKKLDPSISTAYSEIELTFSTLPSEEDLIKIKKESSGYQQRWAARQLVNLRNNGSLRTSYPYPVQIWKLGDQPIMIMGGEPVIEYAIELKKRFGQEIFVMGYANDVMGYIPSVTILREGGYEGELSQMVYGLPGVWSPGIQEKILDEFEKLDVETEIISIQNK